MEEINTILLMFFVDKCPLFCYSQVWRLGFCGKSVRENASWTESAFEMSSKLGNAPIFKMLNIKRGCILCINAGGTAGNFCLLVPGIFDIPGAFLFLFVKIVKLEVILCTEPYSVTTFVKKISAQPFLWQVGLML